MKPDEISIAKTLLMVSSSTKGWSDSAACRTTALSEKPYPGPEGLYVSTGHLRNGIPLGPASARLLADLVLEREPILPPAPYALGG